LGRTNVVFRLDPKKTKCIHIYFVLFKNVHAKYIYIFCMSLKRVASKGATPSPPQAKRLPPPPLLPEGRKEKRGGKGGGGGVEVRGCFAGEKETWNTVPNLAFLPNPSGPIEGSRNHIANANGVR
jgi:hypothetical protein